MNMMHKKLEALSFHAEPFVRHANILRISLELSFLLQVVCCFLS